ncbi:MAG: hypothetical protein ABIO44_05815, partial [Saprospiraceae bacterium]
MNKFICIFYLIVSNAYSQSSLEKNLTTVYLKNGSVFVGAISQVYSPDSFQLLLKEGIVFVLPFCEVIKMVQKDHPIFNYQFKEKGFYNVTSIKFNKGTNINNDFILGYGIESVCGFMFNRFIGLGLGIGYDFYGEESFKALYPIFIEARGYLFGNRNAYYYTLQGGYSIGVKDKDVSISKASGGWMMHPALGIRFGANKHFNFCFDLGVRIQYSTWSYMLENNFIKSEDYKYLYKRF